MIRSAAFVLATACLLFAADDGAPKQQSNTQRVEFPAQGVLHVKNSFGELDIEGWDEPRVEVTIVKSGPAPKTEQVKVTVESRGKEVLVATTHPRRLWPLAPPLSGANQIAIWYHIRVPRAANIVVEHGVGNVYVANVSGDIRASTRSGQIGLRVPAQERYIINAKTDLGGIYSDFAGKERGAVWPWIHRFTATDSTAAHRLALSAGYGDIVIYKIVASALPAPARLR